MARCQGRARPYDRIRANGVVLGKLVDPMTGHHRRRAVAAVAGIVLVAVGLTSMYGTAAPLTEFRGVYGYEMTEPFALETSGRAIVVDDASFLRGGYGDIVGDWPMSAVVGHPNEVAIHGRAVGPSGIFIGIAPTDLVRSYLAGAAYDSVVDWDAAAHELTDIDYLPHPGTARPARPAGEPIWAVMASGRGGQSIEWVIQPGRWSVVIMSADASSGVGAKVAVGALVHKELKTALRVAFALGAVAVLAGALVLQAVVRGVVAGSGATGSSAIGSCDSRRWATVPGRSRTWPRRRPDRRQPTRCRRARRSGASALRPR